MTQTLIQIVPRRSTSPEGVGDYARIIAEVLYRAHGIRTIFIAATAAPPTDRLIDEWQTEELVSRSRAPLLAALARFPGSPVLLHLSGYGYQKKGTPIWLSRAMRRWRVVNPGLPFITVFHEISATGPIWGTAFWLGPWQKRVARHIFEASTTALATTEGYANILNDWQRTGTPTAISVPVFSTIGELPAIERTTDREPILAIFGRGNVSIDMYETHGDLLSAFVKKNAIVEIVDIGERLIAPPDTIGGTPVRVRGRLSAAAVGQELARARFGVVAYDADRLAKSTIFSAYCAYGMVPVCFSDASGRLDGLRPGSNYLKFSSTQDVKDLKAEEAGDIQACAAAWYGNHSAATTAGKISALLFGSLKSGTS